ncbi:MAG TPA: hypothetical protein VEK31_08075 [Xanthobacteraceae bacterium]|nr:hypothetical protein [Xanthobacteraceae bacterium]
MDKIVARLNINHFRKLLTEELDQTKQQMILRLLAEEEKKLRALWSRTGEQKLQACGA